MTSHAASPALLAADKPLLRGVSHEIAAAVALAGWVLLAVGARTDAARTAAHVYGASLVGLFAVSALYHRPRWGARARSFLKRLDHSAIFFLIAGTYTPFCLLLGGREGRMLLLVAWGGAALGVVQSVFWVRAPKPLVAAIYVGLGWVLLPVLPRMRAALGMGGLALLAAGGVLYTIGAVVYASRRPDPSPRVFGYHEVFHALVVAAAVCHYAAVAHVLQAIR